MPLPNILDRMLGYFNDPKVAFVQSPQDFYNTDSFTHVVNDEARRLWEENRIFYSLIQPGRDYWNASFFCGSCGMLRRSALEAIGGFATKTIIEDMETSLELHGAAGSPCTTARRSPTAWRPDRRARTTCSVCAGRRARCRCCAR